MAATAATVHRTGSRAHLLSTIYQTSVTSMSASVNDLVSIEYCVVCNSAYVICTVAMHVCDYALVCMYV